MLERLTEQSRNVLMLAEDEAKIRRDDHIGTEHLLIALIPEGRGTASTALACLDIKLDAVRAQVLAVVGKPTRRRSRRTPFDARALAAMAFALNEAFALGHAHVDTEHILLGLVRDREGVAIQVLENLGVTSDRVRRQVVRTAARIHGDGPQHAAKRGS